MGHPSSRQALQSDSLPLALTEPGDNCRVRVTVTVELSDQCYCLYVTFILPFGLRSLTTSGC